MTLDHVASRDRARGPAAGFRSALSLGAAAALLIVAHSAQATTFAAQGGRGDSADQYVCPAGHVLVGFRGRAGSWIDQLGLLCARVLQGNRLPDTPLKPAPKGGGGGGPVEMYCSADGGIRSIVVNVAYERATPKVVYALDFKCSKPKDGSDAGGGEFKGHLQTTGSFDSWEKYPQRCPGNEYATGVSIRHGNHVNAIGLVCGPVQDLSRAGGAPAGFAGAAGNAGKLGAGSLGPDMENDVDRQGADYTRFHIDDGRPERCQSECLLQKDRCRAWTFVRPGVQHRLAVCYLKSEVPPPTAGDCCISGVQKRTTGLGKK